MFVFDLVISLERNPFCSSKMVDNWVGTINFSLLANYSNKDCNIFFDGPIRLGNSNLVQFLFL